MGFKSCLMLINTGVNLSIGIVFVIFMIGLKILSKFEKIKPVIKNLKKKFEYGVFIRYWVQSYLELVLGAFITLKYNNLGSSLEILDWAIGLITMVNYI